MLHPIPGVLFFVFISLIHNNNGLFLQGWSPLLHLLLSYIQFTEDQVALERGKSRCVYSSEIWPTFAAQVLFKVGTIRQKWATILQTKIWLL